MPRTAPHRPSDKARPVVPLERPWSDRLAPLLIVTVGVLAYSTVLTNVYAHLDDYSLLWQNLTRGGLVGFLASQGRLVGGWLFVTAFWPVQSVEQLWIPRLFSICGVIGLALAWQASLRRFGYDSFLSLLAAVLLLLSPAFVVYAAWASACNNVYGGLAAVAAFWCVHGALQESSRRTQLGKLAGGLGLLVVALHTYQPTAMFYVTMLIAWLLSPAFSQSRVPPWRQLAKHLAVFVLALGVGFLLLRVCGRYFEGNTQRTALDLDVPSKLLWFLQGPCPESFFLIFFGGELPGSMAILGKLSQFLMAGTVLGLFCFLPRGSRGRGWRLLGVLLLLPLTYLPSLIVAERWGSYRTRGALVAAVTLRALCALAGLWQRQRRWRLPEPLGPTLVLAGVALLGIGVVQYHLTHYFIVPSQVEWRLVRYELAEAGLHAQRLPEGISFLMPTQDQPIPRIHFYDEFGPLSTSRPWVPEAMCQLILRELAPQEAEQWRKIPIAIVPPGQPLPTARENHWIIDARRLNQLGDSAFAPRP